MVSRFSPTLSDGWVVGRADRCFRRNGSRWGPFDQL